MAIQLAPLCTCCPAYLDQAVCSWSRSVTPVPCSARPHLKMMMILKPWKQRSSNSFDKIDQGMWKLQLSEKDQGCNGKMRVKPATLSIMEVSCSSKHCRT